MTASKEQTKKKKPKESQEEDFVDVSPTQRNWKGIAISLLVIVAVCSLISLSVLVLTPAEIPGGSRTALTISDLYKPEFSVHYPDASWISGLNVLSLDVHISDVRLGYLSANEDEASESDVQDSEVVYRNRDGHVIRFNFVSNETDIILTNSTFVAFKVAKYSLSPDLKFALFAYDVKQVYRYSYTASYIIYNLHTREVWELNPPEVQNAVLQHAAWGGRAQQLVYIFENNIYYKSDVRSNSLRITSSGMEGVIFNGIGDWLYEEEILRTHITHWWAPDGERLAFLTINDTLVPNMALPQFTGSTYPKGLQYPYPMAGQTNPTVRLSVVNLYGATHTQEIPPPDHLRLRDFYVMMVKWVSDTHLAVRWLNRPQNASVLTVCDTATGACVQRHEESSDFWISKQNQEPVFSKDRSRFFLNLPVKQGGQGEFHHITMFTKKLRSDQNEVRHLTSGDWEVTKILAYDENNQIIYFLSTEDSPQQRHLYSVSTLGLFPRRCVTCGLRQEECTFFDADVSPNTEHVILRCKGPGVPSVLLLSFDDVNSYFILENNIPLRWALDTKRTVLTEFRLITNTHDNVELPLKLTYPVDFSESFLYGLLLIVGSAVEGQTVNAEFALGWDWVLVGTEQVIVAQLDGRGSAFRGQRVLQQLHQRMGSVDVQDQVAALEYLMKLPYIDHSRIGVYGKGYGGYVTLMMLNSAETIIRCAATQAPVIDWTMYASAFSERYFGLPSTVENRYQVSKVLSNMRGLPGRGIFLAHGTADAHVHFQHSAELIKHFIKMGTNYTMQIYPDEGHFLSSWSQQQLTHSLIGYFGGCLFGASSLPEQHRDDE